MNTKISYQGPVFSRIVAGVMKWGAGGANLDSKSMAHLIEECVQLGVNSFDHADIYGGYTTEAVFGQAFQMSKLKREDIKIISKCGICYPCDERPEFEIKHYNTSKEYIIKAVDRSLQNLKTDYLDLLLLHRPSPRMNYLEIAESFTKLKESGKILSAGVSNFTTHQFETLLKFHPIVTNQIEGSLLHLDPFLDGSIEIAQRYKFSPMIWSPLGGGQLFKTSSDYEFVSRRARLLEVANELDLSLDQMAYAFLLNHPAKPLLVTGSSKINRIKLAVRSLETKLDRQQWFKIWTASKGERVP